MDLAQLSSITDVQQLREMVVEKIAQIAQRDHTIASRDRTIAWKAAKIEKLTREILRLRRVQFAARSEQMDPKQRALFDEAMVADIAALEDELAEA